MMQRALLISGILVLAAAWLGPLPRWSSTAFAAHMTMHMTVVAVAAPLLAVGMAGTRLDPVRQAPLLIAPIPVSMIELLVVWAWHAPALHHFARHSTLGLIAEQSTFLASGLLVWLSAFGGEGDLPDRRAAGIVGLLLTSMHMTLLGALLALTPRALYSHGSGSLDDQHLGGAIMILTGGISYLAGGLVLIAGLLRRRWKLV